MFKLEKLIGDKQDTYDPEQCMNIQKGLDIVGMLSSYAYDTLPMPAFL